MQALFSDILAVLSPASFAAHLNQAHLLDVYDRKNKGDWDMHLEQIIIEMEIFLHWYQEWELFYPKFSYFFMFSRIRRDPMW